MGGEGDPLLRQTATEIPIRQPRLLGWFGLRPTPKLVEKYRWLSFNGFANALFEQMGTKGFCGVQQEPHRLNLF